MSAEESTPAPPAPHPPAQPAPPTAAAASGSAPPSGTGSGQGTPHVSELSAASSDAPSLHSANGGAAPPVAPTPPNGSLSSASASQHTPPRPEETTQDSPPPAEDQAVVVQAAGSPAPLPADTSDATPRNSSTAPSAVLADSAGGSHSLEGSRIGSGVGSPLAAQSDPGRRSVEGSLRRSREASHAFDDDDDEDAPAPPVHLVSSSSPNPASVERSPVQPAAAAPPVPPLAQLTDTPAEAELPVEVNPLQQAPPLPESRPPLAPPSRTSTPDRGGISPQEQPKKRSSSGEKKKSSKRDKSPKAVEVDANKENENAGGKRSKSSSRRSSTERGLVGAPTYEEPPVSNSEPTSARGPGSGAAGRPPVPPLQPRMLVHVNRASPMTACPNIVHPLVLVWVVDGKNGATLWHNESAMAHSFTSPYNLRERQCQAPQWDDHLRIPLASIDAVKNNPNALLLFEVLDFGTLMISGEKDTSRGKGFFLVAWGFLKMKDLYGRSLADQMLTVQLFQYPERRNFVERNCMGCFPGFASHVAYESEAGGAPLAPSAPPVFSTYTNSNNRKTIYPASLEVLFSFDATLIATADEPHLHESVREQEMRLSLWPDQSGGAQKSETIQKSARLGVSGDPRNELITSDTAELDFTRREKERFLPPKVPIHTLEFEARVTALTFTKDGRFLVVATATDFSYTVSIFNPFKDTLIKLGKLIGHVGHIHDISCSIQDPYVATASGDRTVRVWSLRSIYDMDKNRGAPILDQAASDAACRMTASHGAAMYAVSFCRGYVIAGGYDTQMYVWNVKDSTLVASVENPSNAFVQRIVSDPSQSRLYTLDGDSKFTMWWAAESSDASFAMWPQQEWSVVGATDVTVEGRYACLISPTEDIITVIETGSASAQWPIIIPKQVEGFALLPDSRVVVAGTASGRLLAWSSTTRDKLTTTEGAECGFSSHGTVARIATNPWKHVLALVSKPKHGRTTVILSGATRPEREEDVISEKDSKASDLIRVLFGGHMDAPSSPAAKKKKKQAKPSDTSATATPTVTPKAGGASELLKSRLPRPDSSLDDAKPPSDGRIFGWLVDYWDRKVRDRKEKKGSADDDAASLQPSPTESML